MNRILLTASVIELQPLRYTPAGVPALELTLEHESEVQEAGQTRRVAFQARAIALGNTAHHLADVPLGARLDLEGFLAAARKGSSRLVLHIQKAERSYPGSGSVVV
ncbi:MAG TPA: primosomal replication protein N [Burkholderiaceae bacterium]|nr:primosomal replication protein N [Burkholderiaceae bacterium]